MIRVGSARLCSSVTNEQSTEDNDSDFEDACDELTLDAIDTREEEQVGYNVHLYGIFTLVSWL